MSKLIRRHLILRSGFVVLGTAGLAWAQGGGEFFDSRVQPIFQQRCLACHNQQTTSSGLSLMSRESLITGGNRGPAIVPGNPDESLMIQAVRQDGALKMPLGGKLPAEEIQALVDWVRGGASWGVKGATPDASPAQKPIPWSFRPIKRPAVPPVQQKAWVRNGIDNFVLVRLEREGINPSPEADRRTLIRRVYLDLTGLLPSIQEVSDFVADRQPDAYERVVDRLLASPVYGERWGRHWLDVARYADSDGYVGDAARPIWMYRDWVINALNNDLPYDKFVIDQIAGDLEPDPAADQLVATGFNRNTMINLEGGVDYEQYRVEAVVDRVSTTGSAFLGLTLGCARCHDHKFDPISQREFYQMYAFFNNIDELTRTQKDNGEEEGGGQGDRRAKSLAPLLEFGTPEQYARRAEIREKTQALTKELDALEQTLLSHYRTGELQLTDAQRAKLSAETLQALTMRPENLNSFLKAAVQKALREFDETYRQKQAAILALQRQEPKVPATMVMRELAKPRPAFIQLSGDFMRRGADVAPGVPSALPRMQSAGSVANRLDLAKWLVSRENPLTSRVTVNRIWQHYFGRGIVSTEDDFGMQGAPPSHPDLLDWLAVEFMDRGWRQKQIHRLIATSAVYRQSSHRREELRKVDPDNRLLATQSRLRLEAEIVRDVGLIASGLLTRKIGGPSVFPPQPKGIVPSRPNPNFWVTETGPNRYRRGMYTHFWRSTPHPVMMVFDAPGATTSCTRRVRSNTPLQALSLLNDETFYEFAQGLAQRTLREGQGDTADRLRYAFLLCLSRLPSPEEQARLERLFATQLDSFQSRLEDARAVAGDTAAGADVARVAAWVSVSRVLLNLDEFITRE